MKFKLLSVVVGTPACIAKCPFCVSGEVPTKENLTTPQINWRNLKVAANLANRSGVDTVMLTSRGEPALFPEQITEYLQNIKEFGFPLIELQTNGIPLIQKQKYYTEHLKTWYDLGLTTISISIVSDKNEVNEKIYNHKIDLTALIDFLHSFGFTIRLTCVCCNGITDTPDKITSLIEYAKSTNTDQLTLRPVNDEFRRKSARDWVSNNKLSESQKAEIKKFLDDNGTKLLKIDNIGTVYDVGGQNVCLTLPLNKNTRNDSLDNARQLIFFQDGRIRYEWEQEGAIIL